MAEGGILEKFPDSWDPQYLWTVVVEYLVHGPYSSFEHGPCLVCWLLLSHGCCSINALGNTVRVYPETVQGLTFYRSKDN